jgi:hypothetical protein
MPRWTPYQDRVRNGTVDLERPTAPLPGGEEQSPVRRPHLSGPTDADMARKRLGFEGLFDQVVLVC